MAIPSITLIRFIVLSGTLILSSSSSSSNRVNVVQWSEDLYEKQLIERTIDACGGNVDIVIDFGTTSRSLHRSIQCLSKNGVVLVSEEVGERLLPKFSSLAEKRDVKLHSVANGTIEQLTQLVQLVSKREVSIRIISQFPAHRC